MVPSYNAKKLAMRVPTYRRANRFLLCILPTLQHAERPLTAREIALRIGVNDVLKVQRACCRLSRMGLLAHSRVQCADYKTHFAASESAWALRVMDKVIDNEL